MVPFILVSFVVYYCKMLLLLRIQCMGISEACRENYIYFRQLSGDTDSLEVF